jgi:hypothetical protein
LTRDLVTHRSTCSYAGRKRAWPVSGSADGQTDIGNRLDRFFTGCRENSTNSCPGGTRRGRSTLVCSSVGFAYRSDRFGLPVWSEELQSCQFSFTRILSASSVASELQSILVVRQCYFILCTGPSHTPLAAARSSSGSLHSPSVCLKCRLP